MKPAFAAALLTALVGARAAAQESRQVEEGRRTFTASCASCHYVPDATLRSDRVWLGLLKTTA